jgi:hypothetical protein
MERFNLITYNEVEGKEQHPVEISNKLAALENLGAQVDIGKLLERISKFQPKSLGFMN